MLDERLYAPSFVALMNAQVKDLLVDYKGMMAKYTMPMQVILADGAHDSFGTVLSPAQEQRAIAATFKTTPANVDKFNTISICPTFQFVDATGQLKAVICKGWSTKLVSTGSFKRGCMTLGARHR